MAHRRRARRLNPDHRRRALPSRPSAATDPAGTSRRSRRWTLTVSTMNVVARFIVVEDAGARSPAGGARLPADSRGGREHQRQHAERAATCRAGHRAPARRGGVRRRADRRRRAASRSKTIVARAGQVVDRPRRAAPACPAGRCARRPARRRSCGATARARRPRCRPSRGTSGALSKTERHVEAMMRAPAAAVDRRAPVELEHPGVRRRHRLRGAALGLDHLSAPRPRRRRRGEEHVGGRVARDTSAGTPRSPRRGRACP